MSVEFCVLGFSVLVLFLWWVKDHQRPKNFPPGPRPLPVIGNLFTIGKELHKGFAELSKEYGPIVGVKLGPQLAVCLHGTELIKEGYNNAVFSGRNAAEAFTSFVSGEEGVVSSVGETWAEQRRFALRNLRDFGFGKSSMEDLIKDEVLEFQSWLKKYNGKPISLQERFSHAVVNSLWKIVTGERFDHDDHKLHKILEDLEIAGKAVLDFESGKNLFIFFYPQVGKLFPEWSGWGALVEGAKERLTLFNKIISQHETTIQDGTPRDFIDVYLAEIRRTTNKKSSFHAEKSGVRSLRAVMADFFTAGTDTTAVTLSWLNLYLLHNPRVQAKIHKELDRVIGNSRNVTLNDRKSLPYTEAVILETLRLSSIAALSVPHAAMEDTVFHGYLIPKGTLIYANLYANHHDPKVWGNDVHQFQPERFLAADESTVLRNEALMPFSVGKRVCLGETLARDSLFLFASNIALKFKVGGIPGEPLPKLEYKRGQLTLAPVSSTVVTHQRNL